MRLPNFKLFEDNSNYNPNEHAAQLKKRNDQNLQRFRAAQDRGDNYGIALYKFKLELDKLDMEKMKIRTSILKLKQQYKKV